ncbi:DUF2442 domain-containing protein [uncultured Devosia sp.]|uniref:DUF2442 domain-containing protein n=1 Tax=uncultured Devosia sp. TaxID=211434 RepID=UPI0035CB9786
MSTLVLRTEPHAIDVAVTSRVLRVTLDDGRELSVPVEWFPRLRDASAAARANWRLIGRGEGIHWPDIDEDISILGLLAGHHQTRAA